MSRFRMIGLWVAAVAIVAAVSVVMGADVTLGTGALLMLACLVPPAILLIVWRGAPPATVAELLYAVDHSPNDGR